MPAIDVKKMLEPKTTIVRSVKAPFSHSFRERYRRYQALDTARRESGMLLPEFSRRQDSDYATLQKGRY
jgi:hypothetical protein